MVSTSQCRVIAHTESGASTESPKDAESRTPTVCTFTPVHGTSHRGLLTPGRNPPSPALSYGYARFSFGSHTVRSKRQERFGPLKLKNLWSKGIAPRCSGWGRPCFSEPGGSITNLPAFVGAQGFAVFEHQVWPDH